MSRVVLLEEQTDIGAAPKEGRVDRRRKLIKGVKILGFESRNPGSVLGKDFADMAGYDYEPSAIEGAKDKYEGAHVNLDHLESKRDGNGMRVPKESRTVKQRFGKLQNVRVGSDGAYADIRYLDNHPLTPMVLEAAEEMPDVFTMSHHAHGEVEKGNNGRGKVTKINQVHSVDLIAERPGTTTSLFESGPMDETDSANTPPEGGTMAEAAGDGTSSDAACDVLCQKMLEIFKDDSMDDGAKVAKFKALLKAHAVMKDALADVDSESDSTDDDAAEGDVAATESAACAAAEKGKPMEESLKLVREKDELSRKVRLLESREKAVIAITAKGLKPTPALITAVAALPDEAARKELFESMATKPAPAKPPISKPRSAAPLQESATAAVADRADSMKSLAASLKQRRAANPWDAVQN
jgi:hypothetical protein